MKRALVVGGLGLWAAVAGVMACEGSSFVETGTGGKTGSTGSGGATSTSSSSSSSSGDGPSSSSSSASSSSSGMTTSSSSGSTTSSSSSGSTTTSSSSSSSASSSGVMCPPPGKDPMGACTLPNGTTCEPFTSPNGCCTDDKATCHQGTWQIVHGRVHRPGTCPDPSALTTMIGDHCGCYGAETCPLTACASGGPMKSVATCAGGDSAVWVLQMVPCPFLCDQTLCTPPAQVCVVSPVDGGGTSSNCIADPCGTVLNGIVNCNSCGAKLCPGGTCVDGPGPGTVTCN